MSLYEAPFKYRAKVEKIPITSYVQTSVYLVARLILHNLAQPSPSARSCFYLRVKYFYAGTDQRCVAVLSPDSCFVRASVYLTGVAALQSKILAERSIHGAQPLPAHCVQEDKLRPTSLAPTNYFLPRHGTAVHGSYTGDAFVRSALLGRAATVHVRAGEGYGSLPACLARGLGVEFMAIKLQVTSMMTTIHA